MFLYSLLRYAYNLNTFEKYILSFDYICNFLSVTYRTAWNRFQAGKIPNSFKDENNNILIEVINEKNIDLYTRV